MVSRSTNDVDASTVASYLMLCHLPSTHCRSFKKREKTALAALKKGAVFPSEFNERKEEGKKEDKAWCAPPKKNHTLARSALLTLRSEPTIRVWDELVVEWSRGAANAAAAKI